MSNTDDINWDMLLRYRLIEILAYWEGRVNTSHLTKAFGIGRQKASSDINAYIKFAKGNLEYCPKIKGHKATVLFQPKVTRGNIDEYLELLSEHELMDQHLKGPVFKPTNVHFLQAPPRNIDLVILRKLILACREQRRVEVSYASLGSAELESRFIVPHTLIHSGLRWSVRAYCEKNRRFVDLVLSRFRDDVEDEGEPLPETTIEHDNDWNTEVIIQLCPDHRLSSSQQEIIATDYNMTDGQLDIQTRGPLVQYALDQLNIDSRVIKQDPLAQQVEIRNWSDIKQWIWG